MEEFQLIEQVEATSVSIKLSLFKENCLWDRTNIQKEEQAMCYNSENSNDLVEINYVYIYDQDEVIVKKVKSIQKYDGIEMNVYKRVFRRWSKLQQLQDIDIFHQNYDFINKKVEIVILNKKYIPYPRVEQIEQTISILQSQKNAILYHKQKKQLNSLLASGCFIYEFLNSQIDSLVRKKQKLVNLEDEIQNTKNQIKQQHKEQNNLNCQNVSQEKNENIKSKEIQLQELQIKQQNGDNVDQIQQKLQSCNRLIKVIDDWIWRIIDQQSMKMKYSDLIRYLLISIQYEFSSLSQYLYTQLRDYILRYQDVINYENKNKFLLNIIRNSTNEYIHATPKSEVITLNCISPYDLEKVEQIQVDTVFFKKDFNLFYAPHQKLTQQIQKYQYFNVERTRTEHAFDINFSENDYPHVYHLKPMHNNEQILIGIQRHEHSQIELYLEPVYSQYVDTSKYQKYEYNYVGYIDRNYWGTEFVLYNQGYQSKSSTLDKEMVLNNQRDLSYQLLRYFLKGEYYQDKTYSIKINYETNIMAEQPRKFTAKVFNYKENKFIDLKSLDPIYNQETQTYQLNFYGRAKKASARNFQVQDINDEDQIFLLHGKNTKNSFSVDFSYPLNILQAFTFSIVSISKKYLVQ
ncbi:hypothetical protein ABPG72_010620 [Tetrahymena utriculariae]